MAVIGSGAEYKTHSVRSSLMFYDYLRLYETFVIGDILFKIV